MLDAMRETGQGVGEENRAGKSVSVARGPFMNGSVIYVADDTLHLLSGVESRWTSCWQACRRHRSAHLRPMHELRSGLTPILTVCARRKGRRGGLQQMHGGTIGTLLLRSSVQPVQDAARGDAHHRLHSREQRRPATLLATSDRDPHVTVMRRGGLLPAAVIFAIIMGACGTESSADAPCPAAAPSPLPTLPYNDDPELAERLPTEIAGQELEVQSVCATTAMPGGINLSPGFLEAAGAELSDVTMAVSEPREVEQETPFVSISAFRYRGADEEALRSAVVDTVAETGIEPEEETIAGKDVYRVLVPVWYVAGDTLYLITGEDPQVEEVLEALP